MLGRLQQRLRVRAAAWGWVTLEGPRGAGATRMLDEFDALVQAEGGTPLLRVTPVPGARHPLAPLHEALRGVLGAARGAALQRTLRAILPEAPDAVRVLARWLDTPDAAAAPDAPDLRSVRDLVERLVPRGPILVDHLEDLDDASLAVLLPSVQGRPPGVLATVGGGAPAGGAIWPLEPLGVPQVELLLRRWLRHPVTARRLAAALAERCAGWPGRVVQAVRLLGRVGHLERGERGVSLVDVPVAWPDGLETQDAFRAWVDAEGLPACRVLDLAAVTRDALSSERLAAAAGVKPRYVRAMLAEAVAARGGVGPGRFFATSAARRAWRERMPAARLDAARERLAAETCAAPAPAPPCPGVSALAGARRHEALAERALERGRVRAADAHRARAARLHLGAGDLAAAARLLVEVGDGAVRAGRLDAAVSMLERAAGIHRLHGDLRSAAEAWYRVGQALGWQHAHDRSVDALTAALRAAEASGHAACLPRIHRALAAAHRGCGNLHRERHHAELAAALASTALGRIQATAMLARADLRAGKPGAERLLARCEADLRQAGFHDEADHARAALIDARLSAGHPDRAAEILPPGPQKALERFAAARVDLASGRARQACSTLELLGADGSLPAHLRAACYAHLAVALRGEGSLAEARAAAIAASALLHVGQRSRSEDIRLHDVLARVFRGVGDVGRAVGHRSQARRGMRALLRDARDLREGRRLLRSLRRGAAQADRQAG